MRLIDRSVVERWYFAGLFASMATQGLLPMLIPQHVFGGTKSAVDVGLVMAAMSAGGIMGLPIGSWLQSRGGLRPAAVTSGVVLVLTTIGIALADSIGPWVVLAALNGAAQAAIMVIGGLLVTQRFPQTQWPGRQSASIMVYGLGTALGLFLAAAFPGQRAEVGLFVTAGIFALALGWAVLTWPKTAPSPPLVVAEPDQTVTKTPSPDPAETASTRSAGLRFATFVIAFGFVNLASSTLFFQYPILAKDVYGIDPGAAALIMGIGALVSVPFFGATGKLTKRFGAIKIVFSSSLARTAVFGVLALLVYASGAWQLVLAGIMFFVYRLTWPFIFAGGQVGATSLIPGNRQGAALGIFTASFSITNAMAGLISGAVAGSVGYEWLPSVSFAMNLVASILFATLLVGSPAARAAMMDWGARITHRVLR